MESFANRDSDQLLSGFILFASKRLNQDYGCLDVGEENILY